MSINLMKNNIRYNKVSEIVSSFLYENINQEKIKTSTEHFIKMFDTYYIRYIFFRKQRDLMIINCFYKMILQDIKINKNISNKYEFSSFLKKNINCIDFNKIQLLFSPKDVTICLERKVSFLKAFQKIFENIQATSSGLSDINVINAKMKKVENLSDDSILSKLTDSEDVKKAILSIVGVTRKYDLIPVNKVFLNSLQAEFELSVVC